MLRVGGRGEGKGVGREGREKGEIKKRKQRTDQEVKHTNSKRMLGTGKRETHPTNSREIPQRGSHELVHRCRGPTGSR